jgi:hypothetical protein
MAKKKLTAEDILEEFYNDVKSVCGVEGNSPDNEINAIDEGQLDWPDLIVTYKKAAKLLHPDWE